MIFIYLIYLYNRLYYMYYLCFLLLRFQYSFLKVGFCCGLTLAQCQAPGRPCQTSTVIYRYIPLHKGNRRTLSCRTQACYLSSDYRIWSCPTTFRLPCLIRMSQKTLIYLLPSYKAVLCCFSHI